jgi:hypothetical protein
LTLRFDWRGKDGQHNPQNQTLNARVASRALRHRWERWQPSAPAAALDYAATS